MLPLSLLLDKAWEDSHKQPLEFNAELPLLSGVSKNTERIFSISEYKGSEADEMD